jgi:hypothetical protein
MNFASLPVFDVNTSAGDVRRRAGKIKGPPTWLKDFGDRGA